jgi:hypothetical protein
MDGNMKKSELIIGEAKRKLTEFIEFEIPLAYRKLGWGEPEDGEYSVPTEIFPNPIIMRVDYMEGVYAEVRIAEIVLGEGGLHVESEDGGVWVADELPIDKLAEISDALEAWYRG